MSRNRQGKAIIQSQKEEHHAQIYQGPIPHPETLAAFNSIIPNGADRIMCMAETDQQHKFEMQKKALTAKIEDSQREHAEVVLGQALTAVLCLASLICGVFLIYHEKPVTGVILSGVALAAIAKALITRGKN